MAALKKLSDQELTALLRQGDEAAFTEVYNRNWSFLYSAAYNVLRNQEDSMDVCQSVFLWLWENHITIDIKTTLRGYLYTAVKYKIANLIRKGKVRALFTERSFLTEIQSSEINHLEIKELKFFIAQLIGELPDKCREVFLLSREEHLTHKEISERLGLSEKTVNDHITRALKKLRQPLSRLVSIWLFM